MIRTSVEIQEGEFVLTLKKDDYGQGDEGVDIEVSVCGERVRMHVDTVALQKSFDILGYKLLANPLGGNE